jgi:hypothetical protein
MVNYGALEWLLKQAPQGVLSHQVESMSYRIAESVGPGDCWCQAWDALKQKTRLRSSIITKLGGRELGHTIEP